MRLHPVPGKDLDDLVLAANDDVDEVVGLCKGGGLYQVLVHGVGIVHAAAADPGVDAVSKARPEHLAVVRVDRFPPGDAGHDAFAPAAVAGHGVTGHAAGQDELVRFQRGRVQPDGRAAPRGPHVGQALLFVALVVDDLKAAVKVLAEQGEMLLGRLAAVRAVCGENADVPVRHADLVEPSDDERKILARGLPAAGDIRDDDADGITGVHDLLERRRADRRGERLLDKLLRRIAGLLERVRQQNVLHLACGEGKGDLGIAVSHGVHLTIPHFRIRIDRRSGRSASAPFADAVTRRV